jgi:cell division septum initiation protein DivIVA
MAQENGPLLEHLAKVQARLAREREEAVKLSEELLALSQEQQAEAVRNDLRFRTWGVCEGLLLRSADPQIAPAEAERLAFLALEAAAVLDRLVHAAAVVQDLQAWAWGCASRARLRADDLDGLDGAERALTEAAAHLAQGTGDLLVEARLLELEAMLRQRQGRTREAAALLRQAEARYRESGESGLADLARSTRERLLTV